MIWDVKLYVGGKVFTESVHAVNREDALDTAHKLTHSVGNIYLWRETKGKPIKWMKVTK